MATTSVQYNGTGAQVDFTITYDYTTQAAIEVYVDSVLQTQGTDYTFFSDTVVRFSVAPPSGTNNVELRRNTSSVPLIDFVAGGSIQDTDLDTMYEQLLHIGEELENNAIAGMTKDGANWDAESVRITNVSPPVADTDAATKASIATQVTAAEAAQTAAEAAEAAALTSANNAATSETNAATSETNAAASAASISGALPVSGLTIGEVPVADSTTSYAAEKVRLGCWVLTGTASASSSMDLNLLGSYDEYYLSVRDYVPGTDNTGIEITISDDSKTTWETDYKWVRQQQEIGGNSNNGSNSDTAIDVVLKAGSAAGEFVDIDLWIQPGDGTLPFRLRGQTSGDMANGDLMAGYVSGMVNGTTTRATHLRVKASTGTIASGTFTIWGINR